MNNEMEIAWAAGFYDGEGCTTAKNRSTRIRPCDIVASVTQTNLEVLKRFQKAVGGAGAIYDVVVKEGRKQAWRWQICGSNTIATINIIMPYLSEPKRTQAQSIFSNIDWVKKGPKLQEFCRRGHRYIIEQGSRRHCKTCRNQLAREKRQSTTN